jgi:hypothetical protein
MQLALYKGNGGYFNRLIRYWTKSEYSHAELIINGAWYSSSHTDGGVRAKRFDPKPESWTFIELPHDEAYALWIYSRALGCGYDWTGIIGSQVLPFNVHWPRHYFCSELVAEMLGLKTPQGYSPGGLHKEYKQ